MLPSSKRHNFPEHRRCTERAVITTNYANQFLLPTHAVVAEIRWSWT
jgi:hypothetical protein